MRRRIHRDERRGLFAGRLYDTLELLSRVLEREIGGRVVLKRSESEDEPEVTPPFLYLAVRRKFLRWPVGAERRLFAIQESVEGGESEAKSIRVMFYPGVEDIAKELLGWRLERLSRELDLALPDFVEEMIRRKSPG